MACLRNLATGALSRAGSINLRRRAVPPPSRRTPTMTTLGIIS